MHHDAAGSECYTASMLFLQHLFISFVARLSTVTLQVKTLILLGTAADRIFFQIGLTLGSEFDLLQTEYCQQACRLF
jgi:hypothetical protein